MGVPPSEFGPGGPMDPMSVRAAPKVLLHDHLDGGVRPESVVDLALQSGYTTLPSYDPVVLEEWFARARETRNLPDYLAGFVHTFGVMQSADSLARVARENVHDLASDGIRYAETRFAPELHTERGLALETVVDAVLAGTREGVQDARAAGLLIDVRVIVAAQRHKRRVSEVAEMMTVLDDPLIVAFDIVGPELGYPPTLHKSVFERLRAIRRHLTIHAGEGAGVASIQQALACGAERLGHGVRIIDDISADGGLGPVAEAVLSGKVVLETAPSSNVHSGAAHSFDTHPVMALDALGFLVTVNTDNRLMSRTTLTDEFVKLAAHQQLDRDAFERLTLRAAAAGFLGSDERDDLQRSIRMGFDDLRRGEDSAH